MTVHNTEFKISYFSVPKCASTSLKTTFFYLENGFEWRSYSRNGRRVHIHNVYPALVFDKAVEGRPDNAWTFALIRDPLERLISCFKNKVRTGPYAQRVQKKKKLFLSLELAKEPSFSDFVHNLDGYRAFSPDIAWHTNPMVSFLGRDAGFFDRLYGIGEMDMIYKDLEAKCGNIPAIPHLQRRQRKPVGFVDKETRRKVRSFYEEDYEVFGRQLAIQKS